MVASDIFLLFILGCVTMVSSNGVAEEDKHLKAEDCESDGSCDYYDYGYHDCTEEGCDCGPNYIGNLEMGCFINADKNGTDYFYSELMKIMVATFTQNFYLTVVRDEIFRTGNFVFSPLSLHLGAAWLLSISTNPSKTMTELLSLFGNYEDINDIEVAFRMLTRDLKNHSTFLTISNGVWSPMKLKEAIDQRYVQSALDTYMTEYMFIDDSDPSNAINNWMSEKTNGQIESIIDKVNADYVMVMTNALYFKDAWQFPFTEVQDEDKRMFTYLSGERKPVRMMKRTSHTFIVSEFEVDENFKLNIIIIPFEGNNQSFAMAIFLPESPQHFSSLIEYLLKLKDAKDYSTRLWKKIKDHWVIPHRMSVKTVYIPQFKITSSIDVRDIFEKQNVTDIFTNAAFGKASTESLRVDQIRHKCTIDVNLHGTEGTASTGIEPPRNDLKKGPDFLVDHPFVFSVLDWDEETPLFVGHVTEPETE